MNNTLEETLQFMKSFKDQYYYIINYSTNY